MGNRNENGIPFDSSTAASVLGEVNFKLSHSHIHSTPNLTTFPRQRGGEAEELNMEGKEEGRDTVQVRIPFVDSRKS